LWKSWFLAELSGSDIDCSLAIMPVNSIGNAIHLLRAHELGAARGSSRDEDAGCLVGHEHGGFHSSGCCAEGDESVVFQKDYFRRNLVFSHERNASFADDL